MKRKKKKTKRIIKWLSTLTIFILIGIGTVASWNIINQLVEDGLGKVGISNVYLQWGIIVVVVMVVLILTGASTFKAIDKIIGKC